MYLNSNFYLFKKHNKLILFRKKMNHESQDANSCLKDHLRSTKASFCFKGVGRNIQPTWGNRIIKDFNDLDYPSETSLIKNNHKFHNAKNKKSVQNRPKNISKKKTASLEPFLQNDSNQLYSLERKNMYFRKLPLDPEVIELGCLEKESRNRLGLCKFEYDSTIEGKLKKKSSHNLSFEKNRVNRSVNLNTIYYKKDDDIDFSSVDKIKKRTVLAKYHPFQSYTVRKVFEPSDELDKFYDTDRSRRLAYPLISNIKLKFDSMLQRKDDKPNQSSVLAYDTTSCIQKIEKHSPSYSIKVSERIIHFLPEVISSRRGSRR